MRTNLANLLSGIFIVTAVSVPGTMAAPYIPADDQTVIERLPHQLYAEPMPPAGRLGDTRALTDPDAAMARARRYIRLGRQSGDPRFFGYAQAALNPWWEQRDPPEPVLILRATLLQNRHDFAGALQDLDRLLARNPGHVQGWLTKAVIHQVRGEFPEAGHGCTQLRRLARPVLAATCLGVTLGLTGHGQAGYTLLHKVVNDARVSPEHRLWAYTSLAEIALRLGHPEVAERHFRQAMNMGIRDIYLLAAYADFLLDRGRPQEVHALLAPETLVDPLLLRLALAARALDDPDLDTHRQTLRERFRGIRVRGGMTHLAAEARFNLDLLDNPSRALALAQANFAVQKQPDDARLLLRAALALGDHRTLRQVLARLSHTGLEDTRIQALFSKNPGQTPVSPKNGVRPRF